MSPYQLVYGKAFNLPVELGYKAICAVKKHKMDSNEVEEQRLNGLNDLEELHFKDYESSSIYK